MFPVLIPKSLTTSARRHNRRSVQSHSTVTSRRMRVEPLEDRRLLSVSYPDFLDFSGLNLIGDASVTPDHVLRLTPALHSRTGGAWFSEKQFVSADFETTFDFQLTGPYGGPGGSDGFALVLQNESGSILMGGGGNLGYGGIPNSLAVEFDIFRNSENQDTSESEVSIHTNGTGPNDESELYSLGSFSTVGFILDDGNAHTAKIAYTPGTMRVYLDDLATPALTVPVDLESLLDLDQGRAWVGFTGASGGDPTNHDILNWHLTSAADTNPVIAIGDAEVVEGPLGSTQSIQFPVSVTRPDATNPLTVTVDYATVDGTATSTNGDYIAAAGTLTYNLAAGESTSTQIVSVSVNGDGEVEADETFAVHLYVAGYNTGAILRYNGTTGALIDAYVAPGAGGLDDPRSLAFGPDDNLYVAAIGNNDEVLRFGAASQAVFTVTLSAPACVPVSVDFATTDGSAIAGSDYMPTSGTVTFAPGATRRTILVPTTDDLVPEEIETILINLSNPTGGATLADSQGMATIIDLEAPLFSDSFELGQWNGLWVEDSQNDWFTSTQRKTDGSYSAELDGRATDATLSIATPIDLTPYGSAELTFDWLIESGIDTGEYLALDFFNGTGWQEVATLQGNIDQENTWHHRVLTIDGAYLVENFQFRFRAKMSGSDEDANVDNVRLVATSLAAPPNSVPIAAGDAYTISEDGVLVVAAPGVLNNDNDADGDPLTVVWAAGPASGVLTLNLDGSFTYTPAANFNGSDSFTYTAFDGIAHSNTATVSITVDAVNDAPVAANDSGSTIIDTPITIAVLVNDTDVDGDTLSVASLTQPGNGTAVINLDNTVTYTPATGYIGFDSFTYTVSDGNGGAATGTVTIEVSAPPTALDFPASTNEDTSIDLTLNGSDAFTYRVTDSAGLWDEATVSITVNSVNDAPVAADDTATTDVGMPVTVAVLANDTDVDGDSLSVSAVDPVSSHGGSVTNNAGGTVTYTPPAGFSGTDTFTYTASDSTGRTDTATVTITVAPASPTTLHVADLDGTSSSVNRKKWAATVTILVQDAAGSPVSGATVAGGWSHGISSTATTGANGLATVYSGNVDKTVGSVTFTVNNLVHTTLAYDPAANTDPDGDSNGTSIVVFQNGTTSAPMQLTAESTSSSSELASSEDLFAVLAADQAAREQGKVRAGKRNGELTDLALLEMELLN